ncbi:hypothetical protein L596_013509 [Steinernema carpocapsae]|uniref:Uncharacterized protein n=1 Tax=Steinernema carpocapsae TaxID=34508 RepID=A0A4U5P116_STECR|nr:hypothetical protein L596_013509 [Steinernema carpocapsae]
MESTPLQRPSSIPIRHPVPADIYQSLMQQVSTPSEVLERAASAMLQKKPEEGETEAERDLREYGERVAKQAADRLNEAINSQQQVHEAAHRAAMQAATGAFKELNVSGALQTESEAPKKKFIVYSDSSDEEEEDEKTVHDIVDVSSAPTPNPTPTATQTNTPPSEMEQGRVEGDWFVMDNGSQPQSEPQEPQAQPEAHEGFTVFDMVAQVPSAPSTESSVVEITACTAVSRCTFPVATAFAPLDPTTLISALFIP